MSRSFWDSVPLVYIAALMGEDVDIEGIGDGEDEGYQGASILKKAVIASFIFGFWGGGE